ncbi:retrovirus-related pol polyprotein from transposon TNT 1-94 [Tanacetum coccineum]
MILLRWCTLSSSITTSPYYVTHPSSVVDYDDDYQGGALQNNSEDPLTSTMILLARVITQRFSNPTNNRLRTSSNTINQAIVQADRVNIQSRNSGNDGRNTRRSYVQEEIIEGNNIQNDAGNIQRTLRTTSSGYAVNMLLEKQDEAGVTLTNEQNDFLVADATWMEEIEELSANICLVARIQPAKINSDAGPSYYYAFLSEVQTPSTSYVNPLFSKDNQEQKYLKQPKIINNTIGDDQIDSNIIFDEPNVDVNSGSVKHDNNVLASYALEQLALSAYKKAEKQQINANKVKQQNKVLTQQLELYKEKVQDILVDATKSQTKMKNILKDPVAIEKKQNVRTIDYNKLNALYEDFVPHKELSAEQRYFSSTFIPSENHSNARLKAASSVRRPSNRDLPFKNSVLSNTKKSSERVEVSDKPISLGQFWLRVVHLEVAFRFNTCYVRNLEGDDLLTGARVSNLYTISISDMVASSPVCLLSKATSIKSWLLHRRLSHLNFVGKIKKSSHQPKLVPSTHSKLELLHMDLCGPMRVATINGKKYILVIMIDYSQLTWVYFLHTKDGTLEIMKKFIAQVQLNYNAKVYKIRTDNGTEFKNATLKAHNES